MAKKELAVAGDYSVAIPFRSILRTKSNQPMVVGFAAAFGSFNCVIYSIIGLSTSLTHAFFEGILAGFLSYATVVFLLSYVIWRRSESVKPPVESSAGQTVERSSAEQMTERLQKYFVDCWQVFLGENSNLRKAEKVLCTNQAELGSIFREIGVRIEAYAQAGEEAPVCLFAECKKYRLALERVVIEQERVGAGIQHIARLLAHSYRLLNDAVFLQKLASADLARLADEYVSHASEVVADSTEAAERCVSAICEVAQSLTPTNFSLASSYNSFNGYFCNAETVIERRI